MLLQFPRLAILTGEDYENLQQTALDTCLSEGMFMKVLDANKPVSVQRFELLKYVELSKTQKVILKTWSPYTLSHLTIFLKQGLLDPKDYEVFEFNLDGVVRLEKYCGLPSDENYLNQEIERLNDEFGEYL